MAKGLEFAIYVWLLILTLFVHEGGHYLAAKALGVTPKSVNIGVGPKIFWRLRNGTLWTLRPIPIGGWVDVDTKSYRYARLTPLSRGSIAFAGPVFTALLASLAFTIYTFWDNWFVLWLAYVNASTAIINLFPLPPFDGGRMLLARLEATKGKAWLDKHDDWLFVGGFLSLIIIWTGISLIDWHPVPKPKVVEHTVTRTIYRDPREHELIVYYTEEKAPHIHTGTAYWMPCNKHRKDQYKCDASR